MARLQSLYWRSALAFILLFVLLAIAAVIGIDYSTRSYHQEATQRLHRDLASWIVSHYGFDTAGGIKPETIERVFADAMHVNPTVEMYLLDSHGTIKAYSSALDGVRLKHVDMQPLRAYFDRPDRLPVLGDDPRNPGEQRIFSVAPLGPPDAMSYLYIVIGGEQYRGVIERFRTSHILRISLGLILAGVLAGAAWGLLSFNLLTRRVRSLASALETFRSSGFSAVPHSLTSSRRGPQGDEFDRLATSLRELMELIMQQLAQLRDNDGKLRELMASLSHDLRTPLTSLGCYLDTLRLKDMELRSAERRANLVLAASQHARLRKLIDSLFELARLELPSVDVDLQPASLSDLVLDVTQRFGLRAAEQGIQIDAQVPDELAQVSADVGLLERVLENLIENALRHTPRGGRVRLLVEPAGHQARVTVQDTGVGIEAEQLERIFDRFYRIGRTRDERSTGAGLGLAITRRIVELHHGQLTVRSEPGKGAAFSFTVSFAAPPFVESQAGAGR